MTSDWKGKPCCLAPFSAVWVATQMTWECRRQPVTRPISHQRESRHAFICLLSWDNFWACHYKWITAIGWWSIIHRHTSQMSAVQLAGALVTVQVGNPVISSEWKLAGETCFCHTFFNRSNWRKLWYTVVLHHIPSNFLAFQFSLLCSIGLPFLPSCTQVIEPLKRCMFSKVQRQLVLEKISGCINVQKFFSWSRINWALTKISDDSDSDMRVIVQAFHVCGSWQQTTFVWTSSNVWAKTGLFVWADVL